MIDTRTAPYAALVLRLSLSFLFFAHLYRKFQVMGFDTWWSGMEGTGIAGDRLPSPVPQPAGYPLAVEYHLGQIIRP